MKSASNALQTYLASNKTLLFADLWTFTLKNGTVLRYTDWDQNLTVGGNLFSAKDVILAPSKFKQTKGLEVNETDVTCYPNLGSNLSMAGSIPFLEAAVAGFFDRATAERDRLFMQTAGNTSLGSVRIFLGEVTEVEVTRNVCILKCKDATNLLNIYMPRRQYQPTCAWTFGDTNCTFNRSSLTVSSFVQSGSAGTSILCNLTQAVGYFNYGVVTFTSGVNNGISRSIQNYAPGVITLTGPFPLAFSTGDIFNITPGCSKNYSGPTQSFNGAVASGNTPMQIENSIGQAAGTYNGATLKFTSGALNGQVQTISQWQPNLATMQQAFTATPSVGDSFKLSGGPAGQVTSTLSQTVIPTGMTNTNGFFTGGVLLVTSGSQVGQQRTINSWSNGTATLASALPGVPAVGDTCTLTTAPSNNTATCTGYANTANFGGEPFVPIPETSY